MGFWSYKILQVIMGWPNLAAKNSERTAYPLALSSFLSPKQASSFLSCAHQFSLNHLLMCPLACLPKPHPNLI